MPIGGHGTQNSPIFDGSFRPKPSLHCTLRSGIFRREVGFGEPQTKVIHTGCLASVLAWLTAEERQVTGTDHQLHADPRHGSCLCHGSRRRRTPGSDYPVRQRRSAPTKPQSVWSGVDLHNDRSASDTVLAPRAYRSGWARDASRPTTLIFQSLPAVRPRPPEHATRSVRVKRCHLSSRS